MDKTKLLYGMITFLLILSACSMAPKKEKVVLDFKIPEKFLNEPTEVSRKEAVPYEWWKSFNNKGLNDFVNKVIDNNLDLKLALSQIEMVGTYFRLSKSAQFPVISTGVDYNVKRSPEMNVVFDDSFANALKTGKEVPSPIRFEQTTTNNLTLRTGLNFELDIWGRLKSRKEAARAELMRSTEEVKTIYLTIISSAIMVYYDFESLKRQKYLAERQLQNLEISLNNTKNRYEAGLGAQVNIEQVKLSVKQIKNKIRGYERDMTLAMYKMAQLSGEYPNNNYSDKEPLFTLAEIMDKVPSVLPATLLENRHDIHSAQYSLEAARMRIGEKRADFFPKISLTAGVGLFSKTLENFFDSDKGYFNLEKNGSASAGVKIDGLHFTGGTRKVQLDQAKVAYKQAVLQYKKTVLAAYHEVESALVKEEALREQRELFKGILNSSENIKKDLEIRYIKGVSPFERYLDAQNQVFSAQSTLIDLDKAYIMSRVALHTALGGNWVRITIPLKK